MSILSLCFSFVGRINRAKYWIGLGIVLGTVVLFLLLVIPAIKPGTENSLIVASCLFSLLIYTMYFAVGTKRLHDLNASGLWMLLSFVPIINFLQSIYLGVAEGDQGENRFGPKPS